MRGDCMAIGGGGANLLHVKDEIVDLCCLGRKLSAVPDGHRS
jgi:hypothetical protein